MQLNAKSQEEVVQAYVKSLDIMHDEMLEHGKAIDSQNKKFKKQLEKNLGGMKI